MKREGDGFNNRDRLRCHIQEGIIALSAKAGIEDDLTAFESAHLRSVEMSAQVAEGLDDFEGIQK